jgi:hypothetical protein
MPYLSRQYYWKERIIINVKLCLTKYSPIWKKIDLSIFRRLDPL